MHAASESPRRAPPEGDAKPPYGFPDAPRIRRISGADVVAALRAGLSDFLKAPQYGLFFGLVYAAGGLALLASLMIWDTPWAIIPLAIAFPLIGPFVAVGLYEVSRRLSEPAALGWPEVLGVVFAQKDRQLAWMGFVLLFVFWIWAYQVRLLLALFLGGASFSSLEGFVEVVTTTENGWMFLGIGTAIGAVLSLILFSVTVISMPLLVDRDIDVVTAIVVSVAAVRRNPGPMIAWAAVVALSLMAAMLPAFLGLLIVLPVLGHATWRLYEKAVVRE